MLLKVIGKASGLIPSLKTDGEYWQSPKPLSTGESLEVKDFIGHALLGTYKGLFEQIEHDPIKDGIDNNITLDDVAPELAARARKAKAPKKHPEHPAASAKNKMINESQLARKEAVLATAAEFSDAAAKKIDAAEGYLSDDDKKDAIESVEQKSPKELADAKEADIKKVAEAAAKAANEAAKK